MAFANDSPQADVQTKDSLIADGPNDHAAAVTEGLGTAAAAMKNQDAKSFLLLFNIGKRQNWGTLLRSACAFGVSEVLAVGAQKLALFGSQGTASQVPLRHFETLAAAKAELAAKDVRLCGVEITDDAVPVQSCQFTGSTAFMLGNEGEGMTPAQRDACDFFVYIPQYSGATASLNVATAGAIVLHHFALWAGMKEQPRCGGKYVLETRSKLDKFEKPTEFERQWTMRQLRSNSTVMP
eukprot:TRINITY_DN17107_c0_g1_i1.p1 TRINITY_DN17107_c0_g1~~TRINITY_DN17107_c0_g1_i1.p1  ORF type:complete len:238 (+),score=53.39 TRINITY_DN17107_c0_g1_i1:99-812(+)